MPSDTEMYHLLAVGGFLTITALWVSGWLWDRVQSWREREPK